VRTVVPVGDDRSRQVRVRVTFANPHGWWALGRGEPASTAERTAVTVPRDALVIRQNHSYVLRVTRSDTVEELDVIPGVGFEDAVEVRGALAPVTGWWCAAPNAWRPGQRCARHRSHPPQDSGSSG